MLDAPTQGTAAPAVVATESQEIVPAVESGHELAAGPPAVVESVAPQPVFRPEDPRQPHDDARLAELGIRAFESRRLKLYTDIAPEIARTLPPLVDPLYDALEAYFGPLPPDRQARDFQMTGYLIGDEQLFREAGLIPEDLPAFNHGRHRANEFWLRDQVYDFYRRHLLFHEVTHCVMTFLPDTQTPVWYMEGMAEYFGTHRLGADGRPTFGAMPTSPDDSAGWGRITLIRNEFAADRPKTIPDVFALRSADYLEPEAYAWSWGLCHFLATHPRYRDRFQQLGREGRGAQFVRHMAELYADDARDLATEWMLFVVNLQYGYDVERAAIAFQPGAPLADEPRTVSVASDRGWQSSGVLLEQGRSYTLSATGQTTLADEPKPWTSEPPGVSIRYSEGQPLGQLLACLRAVDPGAGETMHRVLPIGRGQSFQAPVTGTLYLRINDAWGELADNRGAYSVTITRDD